MGGIVGMASSGWAMGSTPSVLTWLICANDVKEGVDLAEHSCALFGLQLQAGQVGDAGDVLGCQCHGFEKRAETGCK
jgi:hypothetical protein